MSSPRCPWTAEASFTVDVVLQRRELVLPELAIMHEPRFGRLQWSGRQRAFMNAAIDSAGHEPGAFQHADVPGHRGQRYIEGLGKLRDLRRSLGQPCQQRSPCPITQRMEHGV